MCWVQLKGLNPSGDVFTSEPWWLPFHIISHSFWYQSFLSFFPTSVLLSRWFLTVVPRYLWLTSTWSMKIPWMLITIMFWKRTQCHMNGLWRNGPNVQNLVEEVKTKPQSVRNWLRENWKSKHHVWYLLPRDSRETRSMGGLYLSSEIDR